MRDEGLNYAARAARFERARDEEERRSARIARLRLATVLPGLGLIGWTVLGGGPSAAAAAGALLLLGFGALVVRHARIDQRVAWLDALRIVYTRADARVRRDWGALPPAVPPPGVDLAQHPYALDLDLFGRASLAQLLGPAATPAGAARLSAWLLEPAALTEIIARQQSVRALADAAEWREELRAHGVLTSGAGQAELDRLFGWAGGRQSFGPAFRGAVIALTLLIWVLLALKLSGLVNGNYWATPLTAGVVLSFALAKRIHESFNRAGAGERALARYAALFEHAAAAPRSADRLRTIADRLTAAGLSAHQSMHRLNQILGFAELRTGAAILHFPIQAVTLWDFHVAFALDRWRAQAGGRVRDWVEAVGELDALASLAAIAHDNPTWCTPVLGESALVQGIDLAHPLLAEGRRVGNDVSIGPPETVLLITGSNMSGKSTLLRAVGLNVVLAQAGGPACASAFTLPPIDLQASIRVQDSLELGLSYFMAALARLKAIVDAAEHPPDGRVVLYLLDEILQGTNSLERGIAVRGIVRHLLQARAIGALTTHDLAVASEPPLDAAARLVHFTETVDEEGRMSFDYRLRPGLATSRNALRLMELIGIRH
jgi:hypothetical protein